MAAADDAASYGATALLDSSVEASPTPAAAAAQPAAAQTSGARRLLIALLVLAALGVGIYFLGKHTEGVLQWQADLVDENRVLGVFACIGIFLPWIVLCLPTTLYEILVGYLFGVWQGALINAAGKLIGSNAAFFLGRYCFKQRVERLAAENWRVRRVQRLLAERPWGVAFLVRAAQIPIAVKNYGASGTPRHQPRRCPPRCPSERPPPLRAAADLSYVVFLTSCVVVDSCSALAWAWIGSSADSLASIFSGESQSTDSTVQKVMVVVGMAAAVAMVTGFGWWAKKNLMGDGEGEEAEVAAGGGGAAGAGAGGAEGERLASAK